MSKRRGDGGSESSVTFLGSARRAMPATGLSSNALPESGAGSGQSLVVIAPVAGTTVSSQVIEEVNMAAVQVMTPRALPRTKQLLRRG